MQTITTIGLDIAKSVFQVHGVDATGRVVMRRQLKRRQVLASKRLHYIPGVGPMLATALVASMPRSMAPGTGPGSRRCSAGARRRSPPSRLLTRLRGWPGP
jgi:transposase